MKRSTALRALMLGGAIAVGLCVPTGPASATAVPTTIHPTTRIDIGTLDIYLDGTCVAPTAGLDLTASEVDATDLHAREVITIGSTDYVLDISLIGSTPGEVSGSSPATIGSPGDDLVLGLSFDFYALASAPCTTGDLLCQAVTTTQQAGFFSGNPAAPTTSDDFSLSGGSDFGLITTEPCTLGPASLLSEPLFASFFLEA